MKQGPWWDWGALKPSKDGSDYSFPEHRAEFLGETVTETQSTMLASPYKKDSATKQGGRAAPRTKIASECTGNHPGAGIKSVHHLHPALLFS